MVVDFEANNKNSVERMGMTEPETGYGRFEERLREEVVRSKRKEHPFTVLRVSVDVPLPAEGVEQMLKSSIRGYDLLWPLETSEFAIVLPETGEQNAEQIASRIKGKVSQKGKSETFLLQTEIGIACYPHDGTSAEDLLESAEQDLMNQRKKRHQ